MTIPPYYSRFPRLFSIKSKTLFPFRSLSNPSTSSNAVRPFILGIETSCDDTGAAVVDGQGRLLGEGLNSQQIYSSRFGGVMPELAQNLHEINIGPVIDQAMKQSGLNFEDLDAVAVTRTPGLALSLTVGVKHALTLCKKYRKPLIPIHHMQAHALTIRMPDLVDFRQKHKVEYPFLCLLVSGGHCILTWIRSVDDFVILGHDTDGAPGEAFDKVARSLRLRHLKPEYDQLSGGALIERLAREGGGNPLSVPFPNSKSGPKDSDCNFCFAGLKSYACEQFLKQIEKESGLDSNGFIPNLPDFCASFQHSVARHICRRLERAFIFLHRNQWLPPGHEPFLVVSGGVAANLYLRTAFAYVAAHFDYRLVSPPPRLCTDNGIMIAWNGVERYKANVGVIPADAVPDTLWADAKYPVGPVIEKSEMRKAREGDRLPGSSVKLSKNFYDPSHLIRALHFSNLRKQKRATEGQQVVSRGN